MDYFTVQHQTSFN